MLTSSIFSISSISSLEFVPSILETPSIESRLKELKAIFEEELQKLGSIYKKIDSIRELPKNPEMALRMLTKAPRAGEGLEPELDLPNKEDLVSLSAIFTVTLLRILWKKLREEKANVPNLTALQTFLGHMQNENWLDIQYKDLLRFYGEGIGEMIAMLSIKRTSIELSSLAEHLFRDAIASAEEYRAFKPLLCATLFSDILGNEDLHEKAYLSLCCAHTNYILDGLSRCDSFSPSVIFLLTEMSHWISELSKISITDKSHLIALFKKIVTFHFFDNKPIPNTFLRTILEVFRHYLVLLKNEPTSELDLEKISLDLFTLTEHPSSLIRPILNGIRLFEPTSVTPLIEKATFAIQVQTLFDQFRRSSPIHELISQRLDYFEELQALMKEVSAKYHQHHITRTFEHFYQDWEKALMLAADLPECFKDYFISVEKDRELLKEDEERYRNNAINYISHDSPVHRIAFPAATPHSIKSLPIPLVIKHPILLKMAFPHELELAEKLGLGRISLCYYVKEVPTKKEVSSFIFFIRANFIEESGSTHIRTIKFDASLKEFPEGKDPHIQGALAIQKMWEVSPHFLVNEPILINEKFFKRKKMEVLMNLFFVKKEIIRHLLKDDGVRRTCERLEQNEDVIETLFRMTSKIRTIPFPIFSFQSYATRYFKEKTPQPSDALLNKRIHIEALEAMLIKESAFLDHPLTALETNKTKWKDLLRELPEDYFSEHTKGYPIATAVYRRLLSGIFENLRDLLGS